MDYIRTPFMQARIDNRDRYHAAGRRLLVAFSGLSITVTLYALFVLKVANDSGVFIPTH